MQRALKARPVKGCTAAVCEVDRNDQEIKVNHISNFSTFHNFSYEEPGCELQFWDVQSRYVKLQERTNQNVNPVATKSALFECNEAG